MSKTLGEIAFAAFCRNEHRNPRRWSDNQFKEDWEAAAAAVANSVASAVEAATLEKAAQIAIAEAQTIFTDKAEYKAAMKMVEAIRAARK